RQHPRSEDSSPMVHRRCRPDALRVRLLTGTPEMAVAVDTALGADGRRTQAMKTRRLIFTLLLVAPTILLFLVSRGKWSDAIIDSGREWIVPDALARGDLLYRDVVYWFGPFTPYFHAAFFALFGSSFA